MPTYRLADAEVDVLVEDVMSSVHTHLREAGVSVRCLFAFADRSGKTGEPKGPAVKHHGYPALAVIKVNSLKQRVEGLRDCTIVIDGDRYPELTPEQQRALLDHELQHAEVVTDEDGNIALDDANRPKLRLRPHDFEIGVFFDVVKRHGENALERRSFHDLQGRMAGARKQEEGVAGHETE